MLAVCDGRFPVDSNVQGHCRTGGWANLGGQLSSSREAQLALVIAAPGEQETILGQRRTVVITCRSSTPLICGSPEQAHATSINTVAL